MAKTVNDYEHTYLSFKTISIIEDLDTEVQLLEQLCQPVTINVSTTAVWIAEWAENVYDASNAAASVIHPISLHEQESLADAKVSVRQQCVYEGPERRNLQQINDMRFPIDG